MICAAGVSLWIRCAQAPAAHAHRPPRPHSKGRVQPLLRRGVRPVLTDDGCTRQQHQASGDEAHQQQHLARALVAAWGAPPVRPSLALFFAQQLFIKRAACHKHGSLALRHRGGSVAFGQIRERLSAARTCTHT